MTSHGYQIGKTMNVVLMDKPKRTPGETMVAMKAAGYTVHRKHNTNNFSSRSWALHSRASSVQEIQRGTLGIQ